MVPQIDVTSLQDKLNNNDIIVLDIRDQADYAANHIEPSQHLDNANLANFIATADKDKAYAVCCYHGISSQSAVQYLKESGFKDVVSVTGGFTAWEKL